MNNGDVREVVEAVTKVLTREGVDRVNPPPQRQRLLVEPMQYEDALHNDLWGVALFPGAPAWTVLQSAPLELFGERAPGATQSRLFDLCRELGCAGFQFNVYDGMSGILLEVSSAGRVGVSGLTAYGPGDDSYQWNGEKLSEERFDPGFSVLPYEETISSLELVEDKAFALARHFGGTNAEFCDNIVSVDTLINHKAIEVPGGMAVYFRWRGPSRQRYQPAASWEEHRSRSRPET